MAISRHYHHCPAMRKKRGLPRLMERARIPGSHGSRSEQVKPIDGKSDKWASSSLRNDAGSRDPQSRIGFPLE
jgi:hypothetical protein